MTAAPGSVLGGGPGHRARLPGPARRPDPPRRPAAGISRAFSVHYPAISERHSSRLACYRRGVLMQGFPPAPDARVTLANWQTPPYNRWAFSHLREIVPTQRIARGDGPVLPLPADPQPVGEVETVRSDRTRTSVDAVLDDTFTDGVVVVQDGRLVYERYLGQTTRGHHAPAHVDLEVGRQLRRGQPGRPRGALARAARDRARPGDAEQRLPRRDGAPPAGHAVGHPLQRGVHRPERRGARARAGGRWSPLVTPDLPDSMYPYLTMLVGGARARRRVRVPLLRDGRAGLGLRAGRGAADGGPDRRAGVGAARRRAGRRDHLRRRGLGHARRRRLRDDGGPRPVRGDAARRRPGRRPAGRPRGVAARGVDAGRRHPRRLRRLRRAARSSPAAGTATSSGSARARSATS